MENINELLKQVKECEDVFKIGLKSFLPEDELYSVIFTLQRVTLPQNKLFYLCIVNPSVGENTVLYYSTFDNFLDEFESIQKSYFTTIFANNTSEFYNINRHAIFNYSPIYVDSQFRDVILSIFQKIYFLNGNSYQKNLNNEWFVYLTQYLYKDFETKQIIDLQQIKESDMILTINKYFEIEVNTTHDSSILLSVRKISKDEYLSIFEVSVYEIITEKEELLELLVFDTFDDFLLEFPYITKYLPTKLDVVRDKRNDIFNYECKNCHKELKELLRPYFLEIDIRVGTEYQKYCVTNWFNILMNE